MLLAPQWRLRVFALVITSLVSSRSAETPTGVHHGKKAHCLGFLSIGSYSIGPPDQPCGTRSYSRVFTGTVRSAVDIGDTDTRLELIPDELFVGDKSELTVTVDQACLAEEEPEIKAGDRWLFYVRPKRSWSWSSDLKTRSTTIEGLEVPDYSPSKPVTEAEEDIAILRHLGGLCDKGILAGKVIRIGATTDELNPTAVPNHRVVAKNWPSSTEYSAVTSLNGRFELEVPPGTYDVTAAREQGLRDAEPWIPKDLELDPGLVVHLGNANVRRRDCTEVDFSLVVDGTLAGRVTTKDGKTARFVKVAIIPISPVHPQFTVDADEDGHFEVGGRQPGQYIIGIGLLAPFESAEWKSRVYYPGVPTQRQAKIIELGDGEWRTDLNFRLP